MARTCRPSGSNRKLILQQKHLGQARNTCSRGVRQDAGSFARTGEMLAVSADGFSRKMLVRSPPQSGRMVGDSEVIVEPDSLAVTWTYSSVTGNWPTTPAAKPSSHLVRFRSESVPGIVPEIRT